MQRFLSRYEFIILGIFATLCFVLGCYGHWHLYMGINAIDGDWAYADIAYNTVLLFVLEGGSDQGSAAYHWSLQTARFAAPVSVAWTAIRALLLIFDDYIIFARWRLRKHTVICGTSPLALRIMKDLVDSTKHPNSVVVIGDSSDQETKMEVLESGAFWVSGRGTSDSVMVRARLVAASRLFVITGSEDENLLTLLAVKTHLANTKKDTALDCHIELAGGSDSTLRSERITYDSEKLSVHLFSPMRTAVRSLIDRYPAHSSRLPKSGDSPLHVLIVGFGYLAQHILKQTVRLSHYADQQNIKITIVDDENPKSWARIAGSLPDLQLVADIEYINEDPLSLGVTRWKELQQRGDFDIVYIAADNDHEGVSFAQRAVVCFHHNASLPTIVLCNPSDKAGLADQVPDQIMVFNLSETQTVENIGRYKLDAMAMAIHNNYCTKYPQYSVNWSELSEIERDQNRDPADHITIKLAIANQAATTGFLDQSSPMVSHEQSQKNRVTPLEQAIEKSGNTISFANLMTSEPTLVELLARIEHRRWMATKVLAGFRYADVPQQDKDRKLHPCLISYDKLPEDEREKDREQILVIPSLIQSISKD